MTNATLVFPNNANLPVVAVAGKICAAPRSWKLIISTDGTKSRGAQVLGHSTPATVIVRDSDMSGRS